MEIAAHLVVSASPVPAIKTALKGLDTHAGQSVDHGTSAPHFLLGGRVRGGFYGEQPPLDDLVERNLAHRLHFRSLYATVAREWWGLKADFIKEKGLGCIV